MYIEKIKRLENENLEIKKGLRETKKEIKKREKILSMVNDEDLEEELLEYKEEIENLKFLLKINKQLLKSYKNL